MAYLSSDIVRMEANTPPGRKGNMFTAMIRMPPLLLQPKSSCRRFRRGMTCCAVARKDESIFMSGLEDRAQKCPESSRIKIQNNVKQQLKAQYGCQYGQCTSCLRVSSARKICRHCSMLTSCTEVVLDDLSGFISLRSGHLSSANGTLLPKRLPSHSNFVEQRVVFRSKKSAVLTWTVSKSCPLDSQTPKLWTISVKGFGLVENSKILHHFQSGSHFRPTAKGRKKVDCRAVAVERLCVLLYAGSIRSVMKDSSDENFTCVFNGGHRFTECVSKAHEILQAEQNECL